MPDPNNQSQIKERYANAVCDHIEFEHLKNCGFSDQWIQQNLLDVILQAYWTTQKARGNFHTVSYIKIAEAILGVIPQVESKLESFDNKKVVLELLARAVLATGIKTCWMNPFDPGANSLEKRIQYILKGHPN